MLCQPAISARPGGGGRRPSRLRTVAAVAGPIGNFLAVVVVVAFAWAAVAAAVAADYAHDRPPLQLGAAEECEAVDSACPH